MARGGRRPGSGPKAKARTEKVREGTYRKDRDGPVETVRPPDGKRPPMPAGLPPRARTTWRSLLDDLERDALLDSADAPLYEAFAVNLARAREARAAVTRHGLLVAKSNGDLVRNPAVQVEREALREVRMLAEQLAIGMSARARLGMAIARGAGASSSPPADGPSSSSTAPAGIGPSPRLALVTDGREG